MTIADPHVADDLSGLGAALQAMAGQGVTMTYRRVHQVLGEGRFVLVVSEGTFGGRPTACGDSRALCLQLLGSRQRDLPIIRVRRPRAASAAPQPAAGWCETAHGEREGTS